MQEEIQQIQQLVNDFVQSLPSFVAEKKTSVSSIVFDFIDADGDASDKAEDKDAESTQTTDRSDRLLLTCRINAQGQIVCTKP